MNITNEKMVVDYVILSYFVSIVISNGCVRNVKVKTFVFIMCMDTIVYLVKVRVYVSINEHDFLVKNVRSLMKKRRKNRKY